MRCACRWVFAVNHLLDIMADAKEYMNALHMLEQEALLDQVQEDRTKFDQDTDYLLFDFSTNQISKVAAQDSGKGVVTVPVTGNREVFEDTVSSSRLSPVQLTRSQSVVTSTSTHKLSPDQRGAYGLAAGYAPPPPSHSSMYTLTHMPPHETRETGSETGSGSAASAQDVVRDGGVPASVVQNPT